jgi:hypothetical protein
VGGFGEKLAAELHDFPPPRGPSLRTAAERSRDSRDFVSARPARHPIPPLASRRPPPTLDA